MKRGDLVRHKHGRAMALVLRARPTRNPESIHSYIDLVWLDDASQDSAYSGLFEVVNAAR